MKTALFALTVSGTLLAGGIASAQGIALFGDARLGLGYNIDNDGGVVVDDAGNPPDDLRAISRVRFGVNMTGETDSGITFGAEIRADNAEGGEGGEEGQTEGSVFVSGSFGTLTYGDTDGADYVHVGDVPGNYSLTGLTDINETRFISNGGGFGDDDGEHFAENPDALPTVRYDYDIAGFGFSVSTNRNLTDIVVGIGHTADFAGGNWTAGAGYNKFDAFTTEPSDPTLTCIDTDADGVCESVTVTETPGLEVPDGEQWSVGLNGEYETFAFGLTYTKITSDTEEDGKVEADNILVGASYTFNAWSVGAFYGKVLSAQGTESSGIFDGDDGYGLTAQYDLGGGATVNGGIANSYSSDLGLEDESATIADFGISMNF